MKAIVSDGTVLASWRTWSCRSNSRPRVRRSRPPRRLRARRAAPRARGDHVAGIRGRARRRSRPPKASRRRLETRARLRDRPLTHLGGRHGEARRGGRRRRRADPALRDRRRLHAGRPDRSRSSTSACFRPATASRSRSTRSPIVRCAAGSVASSRLADPPRDWSRSRSRSSPEARRPGYLARVRLRLDERAGHGASSRDAVLTGSNGEESAFVIEDGKAFRREVETGLVSEGRVEIVIGAEPG